MSQEQHLDTEALGELREVMEDEFTVLMKTYLNDSLARIQSIHDAIEQKDADALRKEAHSFKGSCGNIGAPRLADLCRQLEELGRSGGVDGQELLDAISIEFQTVKTLIDDLDD